MWVFEGFITFFEWETAFLEAGPLSIVLWHRALRKAVHWWRQGCPAVDSEEYIGLWPVPSSNLASHRRSRAARLCAMLTLPRFREGGKAPDQLAAV